MNKSRSLRKKKWLKNRRRENKIKKQQNYEAKTHKGTSRFNLQEGIRRAEREKKKKRLTIGPSGRFLGQ